MSVFVIMMKILVNNLIGLLFVVNVLEDDLLFGFELEVVIIVIMLFLVDDIDIYLVSFGYML